MGQSEMEYLLSAGAAYKEIAQPTPGDGNLTVITQSGDGSAPVKTIVTPSTVSAGQVNPAMAALSGFLNFAAPGRQFVIGDGAVPGTGRVSLHNGSDVDGRLWSDFTAVVDAVEAETGQPIGHLIECWYNSDAERITNFKNAFWPSYFGITGAGSTFTLGSTHAVTSSVVAHCLWDATASASSKGRGVFARSQTLWHILTPMPFCDAPVFPAAELTSFSSGQRNEEPARAVMHDLASDATAQSVGVRVGPSAHISNFGGGIHPVTDNPDGQILLMWPIAVALLRAAGRTINEPEIVAVEGLADGSYADLIVTLPNGGNLTTLAALESRAPYAGTAPHQQAVTGVEVDRGSERRPVYKTSETGYPADFRGTVVIQSASEMHGTYGRVGRVRITPTNPLSFGNSFSYLRGQATASLQEPRDYGLHPYFLIEHIPSLYDAGALYKFPGVAVRPFQSDIQCAVPAPAFAARGVLFDSGDSFRGGALSVPATNQGLLSVWLRQSGAWAASEQVFEARVGSNTAMSLLSASSGRITLRLNQDGTGSDTFTTAINTFVGDTWYHVLAAWDWTASRLQFYVNGVSLNTSGFLFTGATKFDFGGANFNLFSVAATAGGTSLMTGDIGHLYLNVAETLDLSIQANREKFALAGQPVYLGGNGQLPTGNTPAWYYDGDPSTFGNKGTGGNVALTGTLTASSTAPSY